MNIEQPEEVKIRIDAIRKRLEIEHEQRKRLIEEEIKLRIANEKLRRFQQEAFLTTLKAKPEIYDEYMKTLHLEPKRFFGGGPKLQEHLFGPMPSFPHLDVEHSNIRKIRDFRHPNTAIQPELIDVYEAVDFVPHPTIRWFADKYTGEIKEEPFWRSNGYGECVGNKETMEIKPFVSAQAWPDDVALVYASGSLIFDIPARNHANYLDVAILYEYKGRLRITGSPNEQGHYYRPYYGDVTLYIYTMGRQGNEWGSNALPPLSASTSTYLTWGPWHQFGELRIYMPTIPEPWQLEVTVGLSTTISGTNISALGDFATTNDNGEGLPFLPYSFKVIGVITSG